MFLFFINKSNTSCFFFFFSSRRRHTRYWRDWSSDVCSSDLPPGALRIGELVLVRPPEALAAFLGKRGYLAMGVPLLKHVLALPGQTVCRTGLTITVDGMAMGDALDRDRAGRILPSWWGCLA